MSGDINAQAQSGNIQQPQIPGFAKPNAPIPIPIIQPGVAQAIATPHANNNVAASAPIMPIAGGKFLTPVISNATTNPTTNILPNNLISKVPPTTSSIPTVESIEQRVPEISEWKPDDSNNSGLKFNSNASKTRLRSNQPKNIGNQSKDGQESNEWRDSFSYAASTSTKSTNPESNDWNGMSDENGPDDSNTWSSGSNQRYQYRQNSGRFNRTNGRSNANINGNNFSGNTNSTGGTANGYRSGRTNSSYQSNGAGRNNGNGGNSNSYYRSNETFYQNGSGGGGNGGAGNGNFRDKPDNYTRTNYRTRDSRGDGRDARESQDLRGDNSAAFKNGAGGQQLPQRTNSNANSGNRLNATAGGEVNDRGHSQTAGNNQNQSHSRLPNNAGSRPINGHNKGQTSGGNLYRTSGGSNNGGTRPQPSSTVNA